jgi:hypothetical protein
MSKQKVLTRRLTDRQFPQFRETLKPGFFCEVMPYRTCQKDELGCELLHRFVKDTRTSNVQHLRMFVRSLKLRVLLPGDVFRNVGVGGSTNLRYLVRSNLLLVLGLTFPLVFGTGLS